MMKVSTKLSEIDELTCQLCMEPCLYHCQFNHLICLVCYNDYFSTVGSKCQICHGDESMIVRECASLSALLSRMTFPCPNVELGCPVFVSLEDHDDHFRSCDHSELACPVCGVSFDDKILLLDHFIDHSPIQFTYGVLTDTTINPGGHLFRKRSTGVYYFLLFRDGSLSVQHMAWEKQKSYDLSVNYDLSSCSMGYSGHTQQLQRWPQPDTMSLRVPQAVANQSTLVTLMISDEEAE